MHTFKFTYLFVISLPALCHCTGVSNEDYLNGKFLNIDRTPPLLISPQNNAKITGLQTTLSWAPKQAANRYTAEIARDAAFTQMIPGSPFTTQNSFLAINFPDAYPYYWRVRANTTEEGKYSEAFVAYPFDAVYVWCPATSATCTNNGKTGNKGQPFEVINDAISVAKTYNVEIRVASRGAGAVPYYNEVLNLLEGVTLKGGYDANTWARNIAGNLTEIKNNTVKIINASFLGGSINYSFDGFTVTSTSAAIANFAIYLEYTSAKLTLSNNTITGTTAAACDSHGIYTLFSSPVITNNIINGGGCGGNTYAIYDKSSTGITITNNTIHGGNGIFTYGIYVFGTSTSPVISNNTVNGGTGSTDSTGIWNDSVSARISSNTISSGNGATTSTGIYTSDVAQISNNVIAAGTSTALSYGIYSANSPVPAITATISNNTISGGTAASSYGIFTTALSTPAILNNTISGGSGTNAYGINLNLTSKPSIINNIIFTTGGTNRYCIFETNTGSDPTSVKNNNLFDCATAHFRDFDTTGLLLTCVDGNFKDICAAPTKTLATPAATGNITVDNLAGQLFINLATNDYHLQPASGTICNALFGGLNLSAQFTADKDGIPRTANVTGLSCALTAPSSTIGVGQGWSIGAYEKD